MGLARTTLADDGTYVSVVYSRPYNRGCDNIFGSEESGALLPYGQRWSPGITEFTVTGDLTVGGEGLLAGTYLLTSVPGPKSWSIHFNSTLGLNGTTRRNPENGGFEQVDLSPTDVLVVTAPVGTLEEKVNQFTITFDNAEGGANMCLRWGTTQVCVPLRVVEWSIHSSAAETVIPTSQEEVNSQWRCTNDLEVRCTDGACEAEIGDGFTPMSVIVDDSGAMSVCAYSGCWEGSGEVLESQQFLVLIGHGLGLSTSRDLESANEDIVVAVDRADGIATLKAGEFVHPLLCKRPEM